MAYSVSDGDGPGRWHDVQPGKGRQQVPGVYYNFCLSDQLILEQDFISSVYRHSTEDAFSHHKSRDTAPPNMELFTSLLDSYEAKKKYASLYRLSYKS